MRRGGSRFRGPLIVRRFQDGILPDDMTQPTAGPSGSQRIIDTRGDASFSSTYAAVVVIEVVVLAALWFFSRYFSG